MAHYNRLHFIRFEHFSQTFPRRPLSLFLNNQLPVMGQLKSATFFHPSPPPSCLVYNRLHFNRFQFLVVMCRYHFGNELFREIFTAPSFFCCCSHRLHFNRLESCHFFKNMNILGAYCQLPPSSGALKWVQKFDIFSPCSIDCVSSESNFDINLKMSIFGAH